MTPWDKGCTPPTAIPYCYLYDHFAGGAKVLEGLGKALKLTADDLGPSQAVLHDYGNVSSSTTWCVWAGSAGLSSAQLVYTTRPQAGYKLH